MTSDSQIAIVMEQVTFRYLVKRLEKLFRTAQRNIPIRMHLCMEQRATDTPSVNSLMRCVVLQ